MIATIVIKLHRMKRESLTLTSKQWISLQSIATEQGALAAPGKRTGLPSWRTLIRMIADGELIVCKKETNHDKQNL